MIESDYVGEGISIAIQTDFVNPAMKVPVYAHENDAGVDLQANLTEPLTLAPGERALVPTGIRVALPAAVQTPFRWEIQIRPRSGLALKHGITVLNSPGTIDAGYRNEIGVILHNQGNDEFIIEPGDRIAQAVLNMAYHMLFKEVEQLPESTRGMNGFGSTGVK